ncbi:MAG TPA: FtsX-like permease family protein [Nocardioidaceae bacterium]|nr:FtsX-like permease family protein [Nocardioidaceae bacterium]
MLAITIADLRFRARQFLIAVVGAGTVFAIALLLAGMVNSFYAEIDRTVASADADGWVVPEGTSGPFTSIGGMPQSTVGAIAKTAGVTAASGMVISLQSPDRGALGLERIMMIGADPKGFGQVVPDEGEPVRKNNEAVADRRLDLDIGDTFVLGGRTFHVVGLVEGMTMLGGTANAWLSLKAAQGVLFGGEPIVTSILVKGDPEQLPPTLKLMSNEEVAVDSLKPMKDAVDSVNNSKYLMWVVAAIIVAALIYVSALQRTRDFAVLKAVGASSRALFVGVALQSVIVTALGALLAISCAWMLKPAYPVPVEVTQAAYVSLPLIAIGVGILSSLVALRRAVNVDPAIAFGAGQ